MEHSYIQWTFPNWITVLLMVGIGMSLVGVVVAGVRTANSG